MTLTLPPSQALISQKQPVLFGKQDPKAGYGMKNVRGAALAVAGLAGFW